MNWRNVSLFIKFESSCVFAHAAAANLSVPVNTDTPRRVKWLTEALPPAQMAKNTDVVQLEEPTVCWEN